MPAADLLRGVSATDLHKLLRFEHDDPHRILGPHHDADGLVIRAFRPDAAVLDVVSAAPDGARNAMQSIDPSGLFAVRLPARADAFRYQLEFGNHHGVRQRVGDPYSHAPILGDFDLHLAGEGRHRRLWESMGAHARKHEGADGVSFAVWAPAALRVSVVGDWNAWDGRYHPMRRLGPGGIWELFIPGLRPGRRYKYELVTQAGEIILKIDPFAFETELRPNTAAIVPAHSKHFWHDEAWLSARATRDHLRSPMSVYEVHLASWMRVPGESNRWLTYRELAQALGDYVTRMGFTHVELMPVAEHPFDGSWGYQVTGYFAPTSRFGTPDDFRFFVDHLHERGIGVLLDWVPAHFPKDAHALARYDGSPLYEYADPRKGEHPDWGTLVFDYGRNEVRNFLVANALYWLEEFHVDGLRVDAVASMLYLDYSREAGEWVPNRFGGRENLEAISLCRELTDTVREQVPGALVIAEESTAWPMVSRPTYLGGLGFHFKWNMGWMHDALKYFSLDPIHRRFHHNQITFSLMYAFSESFILPLSHDEVVHMKGSLFEKLPGDEWKRAATLRLLYAYMWCHPGKKLLFMGGEFGQRAEWNHEKSLDWHLLENTAHRGLRELVADLNTLYRDESALWDADGDPEGFQWIVVADSDQSVLAFARYDRERERHVVCVLNATPLPRAGYRVGMPAEGEYREHVNTDSKRYGGGGVGNGATVTATAHASHGMPCSVVLTLPPLGAIVLVPSAETSARARKEAGPPVERGPVERS